MAENQDTPGTSAVPTPANTAPESLGTESLETQLKGIERAAHAAHAAIDKFAIKADAALRAVRGMASRATTRLDQGYQHTKEWGDECVEDCRERIRSRPLTAVAVGALVGYLAIRLSRSRAR